MNLLDKPLYALPDAVGAYLSSHYVAVMVVFFCVFTLFVRWMTGEWPWERASMANREQEAEEEAIVADCLTDAMEEAVHKGRLTRIQALKYYVRFGNVLNLRDVFPKGEKPLKENLQAKVVELKPRRKLELKPR